METCKILLVKPHPPQEILAHRCPIPESEKYFWEPIFLKIAAKKIKEVFTELDYISRMTDAYPDTKPYFERQYREVIT